MQNTFKFYPLVMGVAMALPFAAKSAEPVPGFAWYAEAGMGYDSNAYLAPRSPYVDFAVGATQNQTVVPQVKSGFFVPYEVHVQMSRRHEKIGHILGEATASGRKYLGGLGNADQFDLEGKGGMAFDLGNGSGSKREAYAGVVLQQHQQVYVDHDSGAPKATAGGASIANRYNYSTLGLEGKFGDTLGVIDYAVEGQLLQNDYSDPVVVAQLDHSYTSIGGKLDYRLGEHTKLKFAAALSVRDYAFRHARSANGVYSNANPLLKYTDNDLGVSLRNRISQEWLYYIDYDYSRRVDGYVNYNDYQFHRVGGRVLFEQGALKGRVALHYWKRDYPNAFAYDIAGKARKTYSGNELRLKAELAQTRQLSYWVEIMVDTQDSSDRRYAYDRRQLMVGARWEM